MEDLVYAHDGMGGRCVRLEDIPFDAWFLTVVPLIEDTWIDRTFLELAEWGAMLASRGFRRLPARDPHNLARQRYFPADTDWSWAQEVEETILDEVRQEAHDHLDRFPGAICQLGGRPYVNFLEYQSWGDRKVFRNLVRGDVQESGVVAAGWNGIHIDRQHGVPRVLGGVTVGRLPSPSDHRRQGDVLVVNNYQSLARETTRRGHNFAPSESREGVGDG